MSLICSAVLLGVAVESRDYPWVGWVGLTPLFLVIRSLTPLRAMSCGALWGCCLYTLIASGNSVAATPLDGSPVFMILIPGIYVFAGAHLTRRIGFNPLLLAIGWIGVEFALQPFNLESGLLAGSLGDAEVIQQVGAPLGYLFVAFLIAFVNAKLLSVANNISFSGIRLCLRQCPEAWQGWVILHVIRYFSFHRTNLYRPRAPPVSADLRASPERGREIQFQAGYHPVRGNFGMS
ncbi:hypothetical protein ACFLQW_00935 [Candidatus Zixiibacteriota bacterium]